MRKSELAGLFCLEVFRYDWGTMYKADSGLWHLCQNQLAVWDFWSSSAGGQTCGAECHSWAPVPCTVLPFGSGGAEGKPCLPSLLKSTFLQIHLQEANPFKCCIWEISIFPIRGFKRKGPVERKEVLVIQLSRAQCTQQKIRKKRMKVLAETWLLATEGY